jgi:glycosyltransferase involved in cell wall biosynthesis
LTGGYPNLVYRLPQEEAGLQRLLRATCPERLDVHHGLGHHERALSLAARLRIPQHSVIHDYARLCGRIALVGPGNRYCGEPGLAACEACIADLGSLLEDDPPVRLQRARAERELAGSVRVIAPSADAAQRLRRHFPAARPEIEPWEDDARLAPRIQPPPGPLVRVAVPGAIGIEKGCEVLLACARDAALRGLGIEFVVAGFTADDARLLAAGPVFITGRYEEEEAVSLLAGLRADLAFVPSIWPETWCFALTRAWQAGLDAAVFDLGAQAERVRRTGRGWVLPLGLGAGALNDALFRCASLARAGLACNLPRQQG